MLHVPSFTRSPLFWVLLAVLALGAVVFSVRNFAQAFPVVNLELAMDREGALAAARELAERRDWGPAGFRQAATFSDPAPEVRTYLELELGEEDPLGRLRRDGDYHPYRWEVRHFREGEPREVSIRFTPDGRVYGFRLRLAEDAPGAALSAEEARALAEAAAADAWQVDLPRYALVESAQEVRPGGRVDHSFVYLRSGVELGEGDIRLRLGVAGDELSEVAPFVRVPQAFSLRYAEMRGANTRIALGASLLFLVLFFLLGCGYGTFHLLRSGWLEWRTPLVWGGVVAGVMALGSLNQLPLSWMGYDTALSSNTFFLQRILEAAAILVAGTGLLALIFMAAESLGRRAFPHHPQQWRLWNPEVASSLPAVGRTVGGYLVAILEVGFVVAFYLFAMRRDGWWTPSEALIQPDLLASYAPWLTAVSIALFSGFWEESLFRAVPIAGAALIGSRFGGRVWWIGAALILQAVLFAAGHADYPQQPSYARLVELILPALFWGVLYLYFGLVPVILAHASYNLTLISLPLWVSATPGIWLDRSMVVALGLLPLWIVLYHGVRRGFPAQLPDWGWNRSWRPEQRVESLAPPHGEDGPRPPSPRSIPRPLSSSLLMACAGMGLVLLVVGGVRFVPDAPRLEMDRSGAAERAREALAERGTDLDPEWRVLTAVRGGPGTTHRFVWDEEGPEAYDALLGSYLPEPGWVVRFVRFTGPVEERAEEFRVELEAQGRLRRIQHRLPEDRPGRALEEEEARAQAEELLTREFGEHPHPPELARIREISAEVTHHPNRRDWTFTWEDPESHPLTRGELRIRVAIAGEAPADHVRFIHTPEEWDREERDLSGRRGLLGGLSGGLLFLLFTVGALAGGIRWARGKFHLPSAVAVVAVVVPAVVLSGVNGLPSTALGFTTTQGFGEQLVIAVVGLLLSGGVAGAGLGLNAGLVGSSVGASMSRHGTGRWRGAAPGVALGMLAAGGLALAGRIGGVAGPLWPAYGDAGSYLPWVGPALSAVVPFATYSLFLLLVVRGVEWVTGGWARRRVPGTALLIAGGLAIVRPGAEDTAAAWFLGGALLGGSLILLAVWLRPRVPLAALPWLVATVLALDSLREMAFNTFPGAAPAHLLTAVLLFLLAWGWERFLQESIAVPDNPSREGM